MFIAVTHNSQKAEITQMPPSDKWITEMWYNHTMVYHQATNKESIIQHRGTLEPYAK